MVVRLEKDGIEEDVSRGKKVAKIKRALELLKHKLDDDYVERAEAELGEIQTGPFEFEKTEEGNYKMIDLVIETASVRKHNRKVFKRAGDIEEKEWKEVWKIFEGQNINEYKKLSKSLTPEEHKNRNVWNEWFDGSDMRGWWD
jgi:hypothetical protein